MTYLFERKSSIPWMELQAKGVDEHGVFEATATKELVDRDGEIVRVAALKKRIGNFMKNPVLLLNHMWERGPIGIVKDVTFHEDRMDFVGQLRKTEDVRDDLLADGIDALKTGFLSSFSIAFRAFEVSKTTPREVLDAEVFEISLATIPSNTSATLKRLQESARMIRLVDPENLPEGIPCREITKHIFSVPSDFDVLKRAKEIVTKLAIEARGGVMPPEDVAKAAKSLSHALWANETNEDPNEDAQTPVLKALDDLLAAAKG